MSRQHVATVLVVLVVGLVAAVLVRVLSAPAPPEEASFPQDSPFSAGQHVVVNALGVGTLDSFSERRLRDGRRAKGYVVSVRGEEAFVPLDRVDSLMHAPVDRQTARGMLAALLGPTELPDGDAPHRLTAMAALWRDGSHLDQARYLGRIFQRGDPADIALVVGCSHLIYEIAFVLGEPVDEIDARLVARFPWLRGRLPARGDLDLP